MKRLLLFFTLILTSSSIYSQEELELNNQKYASPEHYFGDFTLSGSTNLLLKTPNGVQFAGGIKVRSFIGKRLSFDSDMVFGRDYFHAGPGIIGLPLWIFFWRMDGDGNSEDIPFKDLLFKIAIIALSAEHVAYHIPVTNTSDISPYMSLLRYKSSYKFGESSNTLVTNEQFSFAMGIELNKYFNRFSVSPYAEFNIGYTDHKSCYNVGVYCGYYFQVK
jgi:hypothetical protein